MEVTYGVGVKNRFALFMGDESDKIDLHSKPHKENIRSSTNVNSHYQSGDGGGGSGSKAGSGKSGKKASSSNNTTTNDKSDLTDIFNKKEPSNAVSSGKKASAGSTKTNPNQALSGKPNKEFNTSTTMNVNKKTAEKREERSRPPRQERSNKPFKARTSQTFGSAPSADNTWPSMGPTNNYAIGGAPRHQKDLEEKKNRRNREDRHDKIDRGNVEFRDRKEGEMRDGGRGRGNFRGRGGRGRGGFDNRGKREYDRHSGSDKTSVKPMEKREGSGAYNWGTHSDLFDAELNQTSDETQENPGDRSGDVGNGSNKDITFDAWDAPDKTEEKKDEVTEEAPKEMTLDEWKRIEEEKRVIPQFNLRKPGEGEDDTAWKQTYALKNKVEEEEEEYIEYVEGEVKHGRQKKLLDIKINFKDDNREFRRGRGRGGRGVNRGGSRGGRSGDDRQEGNRSRRGGLGTYREPKEQSAPKVDNLDDFPSLGK